MPDPKELKLQQDISWATKMQNWDQVTQLTKELRDYKAEKAKKERK